MNERAPRACVRRSAYDPMEIVSDPTPSESDLAKQEEEIRAALTGDPLYSDTMHWLRQLRELLPRRPTVRYVISTSGTSGNSP